MMYKNLRYAIWNAANLVPLQMKLQTSITECLSNTDNQIHVMNRKQIASFKLVEAISAEQF